MRSFLRHPGNLVLLALIVMPVAGALWVAGSQPWSGAGPLLNLLGRLAGVLGMVMLLLAAAVSVRVPGFDRPFGGLTALWNTHHLLGGGAFLLLMAHPLLLAFAAITVSPQAASATLLPSLQDTAAWLGWAALVTMMVYLAPTFAFFGQPEYQRWKRLHALSAIAVLFGLAHTLLIARTLPAWMWWTFGLLALAALSYRLVVRKFKSGRPFTIDSVTHPAPRVVELSLSPQDGNRLEHEPGQFVYLVPLDATLSAGVREEHPYTIASAPADESLRIAVKDLGDASGALQSARPGATVLIDGPYGRFFDMHRNAPELWIGGGIGITPFISRARALHGGEPVDIHLVYCANDPGRAYYLDELQRIARAIPGLRVWPHYFREEGPLDAVWLAERCPDIAGRDAYICGPGPLNSLARRLCRDHGIPQHRIHSEEFTFL